MRATLALALVLGGCASASAYYQGPPRRVEVTKRADPPTMTYAAWRIDADHVALRARSTSQVEVTREVHHAAAVIRYGSSGSPLFEAAELSIGLMGLLYSITWTSDLYGDVVAVGDQQLESMPFEAALLSPGHSVLSPRLRLEVSESDRFVDPPRTRRDGVHLPAPAQSVGYRALDPTGAVIAEGRITTDRLGAATLAGIPEDTVVLELDAPGFRGMIPIELPDKLDVAQARARWADRPRVAAAKRPPPDEPVLLVREPAVRKARPGEYAGASWHAQGHAGVDLGGVPLLEPFLGSALALPTFAVAVHGSATLWPYHTHHVGIGATVTAGATRLNTVVGWGEAGAVARLGVRRIALVGELTAGVAVGRGVSDARVPRWRAGAGVDLCLVGVIAATERMVQGMCGVSTGVRVATENLGDAGDVRLYAYDLQVQNFVMTIEAASGYPAVGDPMGLPVSGDGRGFYLMLSLGGVLDVFGAPY